MRVQHAASLVGALVAGFVLGLLWPGHSELTQPALAASAGPAPVSANHEMTAEEDEESIAMLDEEPTSNTTFVPRAPTLVPQGWPAWSVAGESAKQAAGVLFFAYGGRQLKHFLREADGAATT